jgi:dihydrodipicolinate synthase/N-acetylneuraminate lyase
MCGLVYDRNWKATLEISGMLRHLYDTVTLNTNPIPVKWAMYELAFDG